MPNKALSDRGQQLLKVLVERYIREGQPVGSKILLEEAGLPVSTATIRNIMADLEDSGYIASPHTSSVTSPGSLCSSFTTPLLHLIPNKSTYNPNKSAQMF